jgi:hypothetical protein
VSGTPLYVGDAIIVKKWVMALLRILQAIIFHPN